VGGSKCAAREGWVANMRVICSWRLLPLLEELVVGVVVDGELSLFCGMSDMTRGRSFRFV